MSVITGDQRVFGFPTSRPPTLPTPQRTTTKLPDATPSAERSQ